MANEAQQSLQERRRERAREYAGGQFKESSGKAEAAAGAHGRFRASRGRLQKRKAGQKAATAGAKDRSGRAHKHKISNVSAVLMISVALFFDIIIALINLIPVAGQIISMVIGAVAYAIFFLWFAMKGVRLMTPKKIAAMGTGLLISIIPIINVLPAVTASVILTIIFDRKEILPLAGKIPKVI